MKVVLFCGGLGMRMREYSDKIPKPMVNVGYRPILWHVMKYYAHYGHRDFILCLGYRADYIKDYFINYDECLSNDFILSQGSKRIELLSSDIDDWKITFVDTGMHANIGQRLKAVEKHLKGEEMFLANYSDNLTDLPLPKYIDRFIEEDKTAGFVTVKPNLSYHVVKMADETLVSEIMDITDTDIRINGGCFLFRNEFFEYLHEGEEIVQEPFARLIKGKKLMAYRHDGFWVAMDTFKDKQRLDEMYANGDAPWEVWNEDSETEQSC